MRKVCILIIATLLFVEARAQNSEFNLQNYRPASPSAFQFLKYSDVPVSEYTGLPNISIPLYQIDEDGIKIPLNLTYHAGGIRVSQEASWVGLGWDLQIGSIIQEINDCDDYGTGVTRLRPDYNFSAVPQLFQTKYTYGCPITNNGSWSSTVPVQSPQEYHSYMIATNNYVPIGGDFDNYNAGRDIFSDPDYDSEPDIFRASFLGHSLNFIRSWDGSGIVVLNKKGYQVTRTDSTFSIVAPSGDQFLFQVNSKITSYSTSIGGWSGGSTGSVVANSRIWMLTKIITRNKKEIIFTYAQGSSVPNYPNYSAGRIHKTLELADVFTACSDPAVTGHSGLALGDSSSTISYSSENRMLLTGISFPNGQVDFVLSDRDDLLGGKRLDSVNIKSLYRSLKKYKFNYSYFDTLAIGGNCWTPDNPSTYGITRNLRLRLDSLSDNSGAVHVFKYNSTKLPPKNSFAQDFWGFYNGSTTNTSIIPNAQRLKKYAIPANGVNNSAHPDSIKASLLIEIKYPTGGRASFEYELNQFDNYWVPDFSDTTNATSKGLGVRISSISYYTDSALSKKTKYSYAGGKAIIPLTMYREYSLNNLNISGATLNYSNYTIRELQGRGFASHNLLGSVNGVGYDKVVREEIDGLDIANGKTETYFNNEPDIVSTSSNSSSQLSAALPAIKARDVPENGTPKVIIIYDKNGNKLRKSHYTYINYVSDLSYGARIFGYASLYYGQFVGGSNYWTATPKTLIGYYPIYDIRSTPSYDSTIHYTSNGDSTTTKSIKFFDVLGQLSGTYVYNVNSFEETKYEHCYDDLSAPGYTDLYNSNRLSEVTKTYMYVRDIPYSTGRLKYSRRKEYSSISGNLVVSKIIMDDHVPSTGSNNIPTEIYYDFYDSAANPTQFTRSGEVNSLVWDYNKKYMVAEVKNASLASVAYCSFEADGKGGFAFSGTSNLDATAPTGTKVYDLSTGNITKSGLANYYPIKVSYWSNSGSAFSVNGSSTTTFVGRSRKGWTYYEHIIMSSSVTISGSGDIDELRLYPAHAFMSTYTYDPLIGIQTQCNINNAIIYYTYDDTGRLVAILDEDDHILRLNEYKYQAASNQ